MTLTFWERNGSIIGVLVIGNIINNCCSYRINT